MGVLKKIKNNVLSNRQLRIFTELFFETIAVLAFLVIGYFGFIFVFISITEYIYPQLLLNNPAWLIAFPKYRQYFIIIFTILYLIAGCLLVMWRVYKRNRAIQLGFILEELHYIAQGNYNHKISTNHMTSMEPIVSSINRLVNSTVKAMEEERRSEESKDELIGNMSHDIRTPLTSIIGYLGLIENEQCQDVDQMKKYVKISYTKALQMQKMVEDLFEYTKVSQVNSTIHPVNTNVVRLLEQLSVEFELEASEVGRKMILKLPEVDEVMVEVDPEKIVRVFSNLITNAIKYGGEGQYICLTLEDQKEKVKFTVANDGTQIPKEALDNLFQRFYRVDPSRTTKGSGLGLAISESIIRLHHGKIWVQSDQGVTRFSFEIPKKQEEKEEKFSEKETK